MTTNTTPLSTGAAGRLGQQGVRSIQQKHNRRAHIYQETLGYSPLSNSAEAQRQRLWEAIQERGSVSTYEARRPDLDIMHPSARVMELRKKGLPIQTVRVPEVSPAGKIHNVARYVLVEDKGDQAEQDEEDNHYCPDCDALMPYAEACPHCGSRLLSFEEWVGLP